MQIAEILKPLWRLYSFENGDFQACRGCSRSTPKAGVALQKQSAGAKSSRCAHYGGYAATGGGVRGGKPPQGTGWKRPHSLDTMYSLDTADLRRCA